MPLIPRAYTRPLPTNRIAGTRPVPAPTSMYARAGSSVALPQLSRTLQTPNFTIPTYAPRTAPTPAPAQAAASLPQSYAQTPSDYNAPRPTNTPPQPPYTFYPPNRNTSTGAGGGPSIDNLAVQYSPEANTPITPENARIIAELKDFMGSGPNDQSTFTGAGQVWGDLIPQRDPATGRAMLTGAFPSQDAYTNYQINEWNRYHPGVPADSYLQAINARAATEKAANAPQNTPQAPTAQTLQALNQNYNNYKTAWPDNPGSDPGIQAALAITGLTLQQAQQQFGNANAFLGSALTQRR